MHRSFLVLAIALASAGFTSQVASQTHTRSDLVQCQEVSLDVSGASPGDFVLLAFTMDGVGSGPCIPLVPVPVCLDLLGNIRFLPMMVADASGHAQLLGMLPSDMPLVSVATQGYIISLQSGGEAVFSKTNTIESTVMPIGALSDAFAGSILDPRWSLYNAQLLNSTVASGELGMRLTSNASWFLDREGPMVYKSVAGDFSVTALVRARDTLDPNQPPPLSYSLGGLIVRDPASVAGSRNWLHLVVGAGDTANPVVVEDKSTVNSVSQFRVRDIPSADGYLRIDRRGSLFSMYYRQGSAVPWELIRDYDRPDMPLMLQVGLSIYGHTRIRLSVDSICFSK